jgi:hypothetical protein
MTSIVGALILGLSGRHNDSDDMIVLKVYVLILGKEETIRKHHQHIY